MIGHRREHGVALLIVVSLVALLAAITVGLSAEITRDMAHVQAMRSRSGAQRMAETGLAAALILLQYDHEEDQRNNRDIDYLITLDQDSGGLDALAVLGELANAQELWSLFQPGSQSPLAFVGLTGNYIPLSEQGGVELMIEDQSAKYNLHRLVRDQGIQMSDLEVRAAIAGVQYILPAERASEARAIVASIIDWIDSNDEPIDPEGAESLFYDRLDPRYRARNGPIPHLSELRAVKGIDEEIYAGLISGVTVWPNDLKNPFDYKLNVNTAPPEALAYIHPDLTTAQINEIIAEREERPFEKDSELQTLFINSFGLKEAWEEILDRRFLFSYGSRAFYVKSVGYHQEYSATLEAVVDRDPAKGTLRIVMRRWLTL